MPSRGRKAVRRARRHRERLRRRSAAPVKSFDGRRPGSSALLSLHGLGEKRRSRPSGRRLHCPRDIEPSGGDASIERRRGRLSGRPRDRATGRKRPRTASEERMPGESRFAKSRVNVSPRLESAWGAVKRAMHPSAQPAMAGRACGGRRKAIVQQRIELRSRRSRGRQSGCPFRRCRWQTPVARTSGRVVPFAKVGGTTSGR